MASGWTTGWRERVWAQLDRPWDLIVIGGGITGAGILREAARAGLHVLLVEQHDFASGTSSRSSKMVHGGLRYLKQGELKLTLESVHERERLLQEGRGLVNPLSFLLADFAGDRTSAWAMSLGLALYDIFALKWNHQHYPAHVLRELYPALKAEGLLGGYRYFDAQTDDARLVLRVIREAISPQGSALALNYARVERLLRLSSGQVCGVALRDEAPEGVGRSAEVQARAVISATGAWADVLRAQVGAPRRLRQLRGSHLVFSAEALPLRRAVNFLHPHDRRYVFVLPWEGVVLLGTTDVDHGTPVEANPAIQPAEVDYLLAGLRYAFPRLALNVADVQATFAGVRPVLDTGKARPSDESRDMALWDEHGLLTVTGGKLTTFRLMAHQALRAVRARLPGRPRLDRRARMLDDPAGLAGLAGEAAGLDPAVRVRLLGRYGADAAALIAASAPGELAPIAASAALWAQVRWAARAEGVVHLDDLLLRRVRLGLLLARGGLDHLARIRAIVQPELGWDDARWEREAEAYARLWKRCYSIGSA